MLSLCTTRTSVTNVNQVFPISFFNKLPGENALTSLCPTLGHRYAQIYDGQCPKDAQNPAGKSLQISFIGPLPHITYQPIGGSDFLIIGMLADKLKFLPKFVPEQSFDIVHLDGKTFGKVHAVGISEYIYNL